MSPRAWIGRCAAAAAASAALIMAFQPAAVAAPNWSSQHTVVKYSKHWKQGKDWRSSRSAPSADDYSSRWVRRAPQTNPPPETTPAPEADAADTTTSAPVASSDTAGKIFELTNAERAKAGLPALRHNNCLASEAQAWSNQMASEGRMYHSNLSTWMRKCSLSSAGENVAYGQRSAEQVVQAWMSSPGHRANILSSHYTQLGVGFTEDGRYATQMFGA